MDKVYDCSNSSERPTHRGGGGPVTNDILRYLKENSRSYDVEFVDGINSADIVITNDVFPSYVLCTSLPRVKRMCSPFWQASAQYRNRALNEAAKQADLVIFISQYSQNMYEDLEGLESLRSYTIVRHWVDPAVYHRIVRGGSKGYTFAASATHWGRPEKRLGGIIRFAELIPDVNITLAGTSAGGRLPSNVREFGYLRSPSEMQGFLNSADGFLNLSYRDAATKTVPQAISCGLPVLYADSGGVGEYVEGCGTPIPDKKVTLDTIPDLDDEDLVASYEAFRRANLPRMSVYDSCVRFRTMLDGYFSAILGVLHNYGCTSRDRVLHSNR